MAGIGGLDPEFDTRIRALATAAREAGHDPRLISGYRSPQDQARAIDSVSRNVNRRPASFIDYARGIPGYAAPVGGSQHQKGTAADWGTGPSLDWLRQNAPRYGVTFPASLSRTDPVHSELDSKFYGPVQHPADREAASVPAFDPAQPVASASAPSAAPATSSTGAPPAMAAGIPTPAPYAGMGPNEVDQRRRMANALMTQGMDASPVGHWTQGLARVLQGGLGGYYQGSANRGEAEGQAAANSQLSQALQGGGNLEGAVGGMLSNPYSADVGKQLATGIIAQRIKGPEKTTTQKDYEYAKSQGFAGSLMDFTKAQNESKRPTTNIDMKGETSFSAEAGKADAKRLSEHAEQGQAARVSLGDIDRLDELSGAIGTQGAVAGVKQALGPYATALGIKIDGLDEIQSFSAIVSRLAPTMRPPGSGATSDFEFKQFLNALPQLSQTVEGRKLVMDQMRAMNNYKAQVGELSQKMLTGEIDRKTGMAELSKLGNPLSLWRQGAQAMPPSQPVQPPAQGAGRFAQPQMSPAGALVGSIRQQIQSGQVQIPQVIEQARKAIQEGRDPAGIKRRLEEIGINPADVGL